MEVQVWTSRQSGLHQALPLDDYTADHNNFESGPGHKEDSAHEDSGALLVPRVFSDMPTANTKPRRLHPLTAMGSCASHIPFEGNFITAQWISVKQMYMHASCRHIGV